MCVGWWSITVIWCVTCLSAAAAAVCVNVTPLLPCSCGEDVCLRDGLQPPHLSVLMLSGGTCVLHCVWCVLPSMYLVKTQELVLSMSCGEYVSIGPCKQWWQACYLSVCCSVVRVPLLQGPCLPKHVLYYALYLIPEERGVLCVVLYVFLLVLPSKERDQHACT